MGILVLAARRIVGNYVIGSLAGPEFHAAAHHVWLTMSSILGQIGRETVLYGVVGLLGVALMGPGQTATSIRRRLTPALNTRPGVVWGGFALPFSCSCSGAGYSRCTPGGRFWSSLPFWRPACRPSAACQTLREFPDAKLDEEPPHERLASWERARRAEHGQSAVPAPATPPSSISHELTELARLRDEGVLSEEEFERSKKIALA